MKLAKWQFVALAVPAGLIALTLLVPKEKQHISIGNTADDLGLRDQVLHDVTPSMADEATKLQAKKAPDFTLIDTNGTSWSLKTLTGDKPLFMFFIEDKCPCCLDGKNYVDALADLYSDKANIVGVINAHGDVAQKWVKEVKPRFRVLQDAPQKVISAYGAKRGLYAVLVRPDGTIDKVWPGYSIPMIDDLSHRIAKMAGVEPRAVKGVVAPENLISGCLFPEPTQEPTK